MSEHIKLIETKSELRSIGMEVEEGAGLVENYALHITYSFVAIQPAQEITVKIGFGDE